MNTKATPKSCSCGMCKRGKATQQGKDRMKIAERAFRHASKVALRMGDETLTAAPRGGYYD